MDVVISISDVEFGHQPGISHLVEDGVDAWEGVYVLHHPFIHLSVVVNWSQLSILFLDVEERAGPC
jgi:hypothetical protein